MFLLLPPKLCNAVSANSKLGKKNFLTERQCKTKTWKQNLMYLWKYSSWNKLSMINVMSCMHIILSMTLFWLYYAINLFFFNKKNCLQVAVCRHHPAFPSVLCSAAGLLPEGSSVGHQDRNQYKVTNWVFTNTSIFTIIYFLFLFHFISFHFIQPVKHNLWTCISCL